MRVRLWVLGFGANAVVAGSACAQDARFDPRPPLAANSALRSVSLADLDGDGDLDVLASDSTGGRLLWLESNSDVDPGFTIEHVIDTSLLSPRVAESTDLDGDGDADVVAAVNAATGRVVWYENLGGVPPVFDERIVGVRPNLESTGIVRSVEASDLDGDGDQDLIAGFQLPGTAASGHVTVYVNDGNPNPGFTRFQLPSPSLRLFEVTGIAIGDLNGDGLPDIAACSRAPANNDAADSLVVWLNTGGPGLGFAPATVASSLGDPAAVEVLRLDGDALPEIAVAEQSGNRVLIFTNQSGTPGSFALTQAVPAPGVQGLSQGRLADSFRRDLLAATTAGPLLIENLGGAGPSLAPSDLISNDGAAVAIAVGRIDDDTDLDAVAAGDLVSRWIERVEPVLNQDTGNEFPSLAAAVGSVSSGELVVADAEHFVPDLQLPGVAIPYQLESSGTIAVGPRSNWVLGDELTLRVAGGESIVVEGELSVPPGAGMVFDSTEPILIRHGQTLDSAFLESQGSGMLLDLPRRRLLEEVDGSLSAAPTGALPMPRDVRLFRPSSDEPAAIAAVSEEVGGGTTGLPGSLVVYTEDAMSPNGWTPVPVDDLEAGRHQSLAPGDIDRDGVDDLVSVFEPASGAQPELRVHVSDGSSPPSFTTTTVALSQSRGGQVVFDLDRDGMADIVTPTGYYRQAQSLSFTFVPFPLVAGDVGFGVAIARLNADFDADVLVHTGTVSGQPADVTGFRLVALEADGNGGFVPSVIASLDRSMDPTCIGDCYPAANVTTLNLNTLVAADLDRDGDDDVVLSEDDGLTVYINDAGGYLPVQTFDELVWDESAAVDLGGDGVLDLAVASTFQSAVLLIENPAIAASEPRELVRPVERAAAIDVGDIDGDDVLDLVFAASAFDRVALLRRGAPEIVDLINPTARLGSADVVDLRRGTVRMTGGTIDAGNDLLIRRGGSLLGEGEVIGSIMSGGTVAPRPSILVQGAYAQYDAENPLIRGTLDVLLPTSAVDPLIAQSAALAGDLRVESAPGVVLGPQARTLVRAQAFDPAFDRFESALLPTLPVDVTGQLEAGTGRVQYVTQPGFSVAQLAPLPLPEPPLAESPFVALATPADGVIGDVVGGPNGGPDGVPDLVITYPELPDAPAGGVALLLGELSEQGCLFRPVAVYTGKNADGPVAVEIGDFDGDGVPEIAFGNRGTSPSSRFVHLLDANSASPVPLTDSQLPPVPLRGDRRITDLAVLSGGSAARRGPPSPATLLTLSGGGITGTVTASMYNAAIEDWDVCDVDVCDDPDSFDPIDPDGAALLLGDGFASTSKGDDKVLVASNTGGMPDTFPTEAFGVGANPTEIRAEDLNNDGFPDIALINETAGTVSVLVNIMRIGSPGDRSFADAVEWTLRSDPADPDPVPSSIALADLDDDGDLDIAVVSTDSSGTRAVRSLTNLFVETGSLAFTLPENLPTQPAQTPLLVREFDAESAAGVMLNDDLVVLVDPDAGSVSATRSSLGPGFGHAILCSEAPACLPDVNGDGLLTPADFNAWILAYNQGSPAADQNGDGLLTPADFNAWIFNYNAGC